MQKGFASLEVILAVPIITLLATVATLPTIRRRRQRFTIRRITRSSEGVSVMQKGFASLEVILFALIISLLATVAALPTIRRRQQRFTIRRIIRSSEGVPVMQKGFASLEVILSALIISLLATIAVPNAVKFVDKAALDYEQKRLYSELEFVRTQNRTATVLDTGMNMNGFFTSRITVAKRVELELNRRTGNYQVLRDTETFREPHYLSYGVTFDDETSYFPSQIWFTPSGNAEFYPKPPGGVTIVLKSRLGLKSKIVFDSVGRIRGDK